MLADYYDRSKSDDFDKTFRKLYIGKHPTAAWSSFLVLCFDFSLIRAGLDMKASFNSHINSVLKEFLRTNAKFLGNPKFGREINDNSTGSLELVLVSS